METPSSAISTPRRREQRLRLFNQLAIITGNLKKKLSVTFKIANDEEKDNDSVNGVDDNSMALLAIPDGPVVSMEQFGPTFHSFVITCQNGQRIFGASLITAEKTFVKEQEKIELNLETNLNYVFVTKALVALTCRPVVSQLKSLLEWCSFEADCNPKWLKTSSQLRLPSKGKCVKINLPKLKKSKQFSNSLNGHQEYNLSHQMIIFRPASMFPLFDYQFRDLFTLLSPKLFLTAYSCALMETQILITSSNYYQLMLVAESITTLLNPFKWQHVYVPILPNKLGFHYLDAPTPFIMGINSRYSSSLTNHQQIFCKIDCDNHSVECADLESIVLPPFLDDLQVELEELLKQYLKVSSFGFGAQSDALKRVNQIAKKHNVINEFDYLDDLKLNQAIRMLFYRTIKRNILTKYQQFIFPGNTKKEAIKFDGVSYLSDQPAFLQEFLSHFLEMQMFATFIDEQAKQIRRNQRSQSQMQLNNQFQFELQDQDDELDDLFSDDLLEARYNSAQILELQDFEQSMITPPTIDMNVKILPSPFASPRIRRKKFVNSNSNSNGTVNEQSIQSPSRVPSALTAQTNWRVVETLIREVKQKTKRILLEKMGSDEVNSLGCGSVGGLEENTMIASLCDLIERIWSHARADAEEGTPGHQGNQKCYFWSHLVSFYQIESANSINSSNKTVNSSILSPALPWGLLRKRNDSLSQLSLASESQSPKSTPPSPSRQPLNNNHMKSVSTTLFYDLRSICGMKDIKTDIGKSRAFIRLALERKLLSKHLRTLLSNQELMLSMYKRYAFLRCEEEREQFLTHLLTLNAVDLMCFTNTFTTSTLPYTLWVHGSAMFTGWFTISGTISRTNRIDIPEACTCIAFKHRNLGVVITLTIGVNHGTKLFIEYCFVRNEITGHVYRFNCNRWFGRNIDDGATERVMIGELITCSISDAIKKSYQSSRSSSIGRNWFRSSDNQQVDKDDLSIEELQTLLGENVNQIMKYYFSENQNGDHHLNEVKKLVSKFQKQSSASSTLNKSSRNLRSRNLLNLLFGNRKLLWIIERIFYFGFKNGGRSSFRKQNYIWDYILRIQCEFKIQTQYSIKNQTIEVRCEETTKSMHKFIDLIDSISTKALHFGKDSKFQLFITLSLRDHLMSQFLTFLTKPSLAQLYYEQKSFLREPNLISFLSQIFETFNDINFTIEPSLTKDL